MNENNNEANQLETVRHLICAIGNNKYLKVIKLIEKNNINKDVKWEALQLCLELQEEFLAFVPEEGFVNLQSIKDELPAALCTLDAELIQLLVHETVVAQGSSINLRNLSKNLRTFKLVTELDNLLTDRGCE